MKNILTRVSILLMSIALVACSGDDDDNGGDTGQLIIPPGFTSSELRIHHLSPDSPTVNVYLDTDPDSNLAPADVLGYSTSTEVLDVEAEYYTARIDAQIARKPTTDDQDITRLESFVEEFELALFGGTAYEVFAVNSFDEIELVTVSRSRAFDQEMARMTVLHAASSAPEVDVHVTAPGAELTTETILGTFEFKEILGPVEIDPGAYQVRVTLAGTETVVYDSGELELNAGLDVVAAAITNPSLTDSEGKSPIALSLSLDEDRASVLYSADDGADLRVIHNSADAPPVDVVVNDAFDAPLVEDLAFPDFTSPYVNVPADNYNVKVTAANTMSAVIDADLDLENGGIYSVYAVNALTAIEPLVLADAPRSIATEARLRVVHGSVNAGPVTVSLETDEGVRVGSQFSLDFLQAWTYLSLGEGTYNVTVKSSGTETVILGPVSIELVNGRVYTILARDGAGLEGLGITLLDDFVTE